MYYMVFHVSEFKIKLKSFVVSVTSCGPAHRSARWPTRLVLRDLSGLPLGLALGAGPRAAGPPGPTSPAASTRSLCSSTSCSSRTTRQRQSPGSWPRRRVTWSTAVG